MYWLLNYDEQDRIREVVLRLHDMLATPHRRVQEDQTFPFVGRKDRGISSTIIESLSPEGGTICDPFAGSGTFVYSALDCNRTAIANEWEPYAHEMMSAPFRELPLRDEFEEALSAFNDEVLPVARQIYKTKCPECGEWTAVSLIRKVPSIGRGMRLEVSQVVHPPYCPMCGYSRWREGLAKEAEKIANSD